MRKTATTTEKENDMNGTPTKLKSGAWGARIKHASGIKDARQLHAEHEGDAVTITTRAGKTWHAIIDRVLWSDGKIMVVATRSAGRPRQSRAGSNGSKPRGRLVGTHTSHPCGCGNWSGAGSPCLYGYGEAKDEGEAHLIEWERV